MFRRVGERKVDEVFFDDIEEFSDETLEDLCNYIDNKLNISNLTLEGILNKAQEKREIILNGDGGSFRRI
jgi:hypothetical protein